MTTERKTASKERNGSKRSDKLIQVIQGIPGGEILNIVFTATDPDAMGIALELKRNVGKINENIASKIYYCGGMAHDQNKALFNAFDLGSKMKPISELDWDEAKHFALVDSSKTDDVRLGGHEIVPLITIDHHRQGDVEETEETFVCIEDVRAASTLMVELSQEMELFSFTEDEEYIAVMLCIGIHTDTNGLRTARRRDLEAYKVAYGCVSNTSLIQTLLRYPKSTAELNAMQHALNNRYAEGSRLVSIVGSISEDRSADLATVANYLIDFQEFSIVIVCGLDKESGGIRFSARCKSITTSLAAFLERFGKGSGAKGGEDGYSEGGGFIPFNAGPILNGRSEETMLQSILLGIAELAFRE